MLIYIVFVAVRDISFIALSGIFSYFEGRFDKFDAAVVKAAALCGGGHAAVRSRGSATVGGVGLAGNATGGGTGANDGDAGAPRYSKAVSAWRGRLLTARRHCPGSAACAGAVVSSRRRAAATTTTGTTWSIMGRLHSARRCHAG